MINRIIKLKIKEKSLDDFINFISTTNEKVLESEGCKQIELLRDKDDKTVFFMYQFWESEKDLTKFHRSDFYSRLKEQLSNFYEENEQAWIVENFYDKIKK